MYSLETVDGTGMEAPEVDEPGVARAEVDGVGTGEATNGSVRSLRSAVALLFCSRTAAAFLQAIHHFR